MVESQIEQMTADGLRLQLEMSRSREKALQSQLDDACMRLAKVRVQFSTLEARVIEVANKRGFDKQNMKMPMDFIEQELGRKI